MKSNYALVGFIVGLAVSAALLILLMPAVLDGSSPVQSWLLWVLGGIAVASATGLVRVRRSRGS